MKNNVKSGQIEESDLFIASQVQSLEDFLKTDIANGRHIYCSFPNKLVDDFLAIMLKRRKVKSIKFSCGAEVYL